MTTATFFSVKDADASVTGIAVDGTSHATALTDAATTTVNVGWYTGAYTSGYILTFLQFDLTSLDPGTTLVSSTSLDLWYNTLPGASLVAYKSTSSWVETNGTATPTYDTSAATAAMPKANTTAYQVSSDALFTTWAQAWVEDSTTNFGITVTANAATASSGTVWAREQTGTTNDPFLSVTYSTTAKGVQPTLGPGRAAQQRSRW